MKQKGFDETNTVLAILKIVVTFMMSLKSYVKVTLILLEKALRWRPLSDKTEGYRTYIFYLDRTSKSILLYQKLNKGFLFLWFEIVLALGLLFN